MKKNHLVFFWRKKFNFKSFYNIFFLQGMDGSTVYYENNNNYPKNNKPGYANRKESTDSGISDFSSISSRKTSAISTSSIGSNLNEDKILEDVKEELPPMEVCECVWLWLPIMYLR